MSIHNIFLYVAVVRDTDGSAFITKAEFDSLKNNFQAQIDNYNSSIDSKIDGAIASYLSGIQLSSEGELKTIYGSKEDGLFFASDDWLPDLPSINCSITKILARWQRPSRSNSMSGTLVTEYTSVVNSDSNNLFLDWNPSSGKGILKFAGDACLIGSRLETFNGLGPTALSAPDSCIIAPYNWYNMVADSGFLINGQVFMTAPEPNLWDYYFNGTLSSGPATKETKISFWNFTKNDGSYGNWGRTDAGRDCWGSRGVQLLTVNQARTSASNSGSTVRAEGHINSKLNYQKNRFKPTTLWYNEIDSTSLHPVYDWYLKETFLGYRSYPIQNNAIFGEGNNVTTNDAFMFNNKTNSDGSAVYSDWVYVTSGQTIMNCAPTYSQGSSFYYFYGGNFGPLPALTTKARFDDVTYDGSWVDPSLVTAVSAIKITESIPLFYTKYDSEYTIPLTFTDTSNHWVWLSGSPIPASFKHTNNFTNDLVFSTPIQSNGASLVGETGVITVRIPANTLVYIKASKAVTTDDCSCEIKGPIVAKFSKPN